MKVHAVFGRTGEFSDAQEWLVALFTTEKSAEAAADSLNAVAKSHNIHYDDQPWRRASRRRRDSAGLLALREAGDEGVSLDYTGVEYVHAGPYRLLNSYHDLKKG